MQHSLVTIAIPAYKPYFIEQAIISALEQTYHNIEVVIVNDKSPYDIKSIVDKFSDKRISYYVNKENVGSKDPSRNWNECLKYAKGDFICILCDDDLYDKDFVSTLVSLAEKYPECNVFRSGVKEIDAQGNVTSLFPLAQEHEDVTEYIWHLHSGNNRQTMSEWMIKTEKLKEIGGYVNQPMAWGSDCSTIFTLAKHGGVASSPLRLMSFRNTDKNISGCDYSYIPEKICGWTMQCDLAISIIERSNSPYKEIICKEVERDKRAGRKILVKHAGLHDLNTMMKSPHIYGMNIGKYLNGIFRNLIWLTGLRKKK